MPSSTSCGRLGSLLGFCSSGASASAAAAGPQLARRASLKAGSGCCSGRVGDQGECCSEDNPAATTRMLPTMPGDEEKEDPKEDPKEEDMDDMMYTTTTMEEEPEMMPTTTGTEPDDMVYMTGAEAEPEPHCMPCTGGRRMLFGSQPLPCC